MLVDWFVLLWGALIMGSPIGLCDQPGDRRTFTDAQRAEVSSRVSRASEAHGDSRIAQAFFASIVERESHGRSSVRHTRGPGENGLGPMGLSLASHAAKWTGSADPDFCMPEVSLEVAHAIAWIAIDKYRARTFLEIQAVYSGRWVRTPDGMRADPSDRTVRTICGRMAARGYSCDQIIGKDTLGPRVPLERRADSVRKIMAW